MPPHVEVPVALRKLRSAGFRLFTLTDNLLEVQTCQLEHGGIVDLFERRSVPTASSTIGPRARHTATSSPSSVLARQICV
jgi:hypothetical protein